MATGNGTPEDPWVLTTPSGQPTYEMHRDAAADPPALVCQVGCDLGTLRVGGQP